MRPIDADELGRHKFLTPDVVEAKKWLPAETKAYQQGWNDAIDAIIDNAPTVDPRIEYGTDGQPYRLFVSGGRVVPDTLQGWRYEEGKITALEDRATGKWVKETSGYYCYFKCNNCNNCISEKTNYCSNCGADMRGGAE